MEELDESRRRKRETKEEQTKEGRKEMEEA